MSISKTLKTFGEKNIVISLNSNRSGLDGLVVPIGDIFFLKIKVAEKTLEPILEAKNKVDSDLCLVARGVFHQLVKLSESDVTNSWVNVSFRELENMLRDQNATRSFDQKYNDFVESLTQELKVFLIRLDSVNNYLENELNQKASLERSSFFEDLKSFHQIRKDMQSLFNVSENQLPRLNTWDKKRGELSFIIDHHTKLSILDSEFFRLLWLDIEGINQIKMVASEGP